MDFKNVYIYIYIYIYHKMHIEMKQGVVGVIPQKVWINMLCFVKHNNDIHNYTYSTPEAIR